MKLLSNDPPHGSSIKQGLTALGVATLLATGAHAQDEYLLKSGRQQSLRTLDFITPFADQQLEALGNVILQGDFDGDGYTDSARRGAGEQRWATTVPRLFIDDLLPFFSPDDLVTAVGDFDGDLRDEIAWRLNGCPFWVVDNPTGDHYIMFDGVNGVTVATEFMSVEVADFDCDGNDEIAWRQAGWTGWAISDATAPIRVVWDDLGTYNPLVSALAVGDFDDNGCADLAWRNPGDDAWNVNTLDQPLWFLEDGMGSSFDKALVAIEVGDFDDSGSDDIAWRHGGSASWTVDSVPSVYSIFDGFPGFDPVLTRSVSGDFDGDGTDDVGYREKGWTEWTFQSFGNPTKFMTESPNTFDPQFPLHVGDFNGDGKDDVAWLPLDTDIWEVDTEGEPEQQNITRWQEATEDLDVSIEIIYTDVDDDGELNDLVMMVKNPDGSAFLVHKPIMQAAFAKAQGMTITSAWYDGLSPAQKQALFDDSMGIPELQSTFLNTISANESGAPLSLGTAVFNQSNANGNFDSITEMSGEVEYVTVSDINWDGQVSGDVKVIDFSASGVFDENAVGGEVNFNVANLNLNFDDNITGEVVALDSSANMYVGEGGFSMGGGATLVGAETDFGSPEGSHVSLGLGFGIGAGVGGSWGENDLYGFEVDIKFLKFGVYVSGEDAEEAFDAAIGWCVDAGNDIADWAENAWAEATQFFENAGEEFVGAMNSLFNGLNVALDKTAEGFELIANTFESAVTVATKEIGNLATDVWDSVSTGVNTAIDTIGNGAKAAGGWLVKTWNSIF